MDRAKALGGVDTGENGKGMERIEESRCERQGERVEESRKEPWGRG